MTVEKAVPKFDWCRLLPNRKKTGGQSLVSQTGARKIVMTDPAVNTGAPPIILTVAEDGANSSQQVLMEKPVKVSHVPPPPKDLYQEAAPKRLDSLISELDVPSRFPQWIKNLLFWILCTPALLAPACLIYLSNPKAAYFGLTPTSPLKGGIFSASALLGISFGFYMGSLTAIAFLVFLIRILESGMNQRILGARTRATFKHFLMIRQSFSRLVAIIPTWTLSQWFVVLPTSAPQFFSAIFIIFTLLFVKDIIIQRVSINYHTTYHEERIKTNKMALKCMKKLRKHYIPHHRNHRFSIGGDRPDSPDSVEESVEDYHVESKNISTARVEEMAGLLFKEMTLVMGKQELISEDMYPILGKEDGEAFFKYLDTDGNGDLTRKEFIQGISHVYEDRDILAKTLAESDDVISRLDWFVTNLFSLMAAVICMYIFNVSQSVMVFLSANIFFIIHFFFDEMLTEAFTSIVFVFVTHPFDTGDVVLVDGTQYIVRKIGLWYSSFYGAGRRLVYRRNAELCNAIITNISRSDAMSEDFNTVVSMDTSAPQILALEERMSKFMKANCREYDGFTYAKNIRLANSDALIVQFEFKHKSNHANGSVKNRRSILFMNFFKDSMQLLDIRLAPYSHDLPFSHVLP